MRKVFTTEGLPPSLAFHRWRETLVELIAPLEFTHVGCRPFKGTLEATTVGSLPIARVSSNGMRSEVTPHVVRQYDGCDYLTINLITAGAANITHKDQATIVKSGEFILYDHGPRIISPPPDQVCGQIYSFNIPRERLERDLGPVRVYANMAIGADLSSVSLARAFLDELIHVGNKLDAETAARMASIGISLIVASIAERMARDTPKALRATVLVQRAKAYVGAHLSDPSLDPPQLAGAMGISLRYLNQLFHDRGQHVSDWIWQRRLAVAAERLRDPACAHLSIGTVANNCGFTSQAHFSRRFRDVYGITPNEARRHYLRQRN